MRQLFWKSLEKTINFLNSEKIQIFSRGQKIGPEFQDKRVAIHNGTRFFEITVSEKMVGHSFGEFSPTRKFPIHKKKKK